MTKTTTATYKVSDMHCPSCPRLIQMDLEAKPGVVAANASYDTQLVVVEYDPSEITSAEIINTIKQTGYTAAAVI